MRWKEWNRVSIRTTLTAPSPAHAATSSRLVPPSPRSTSKFAPSAILSTLASRSWLTPADVLSASTSVSAVSNYWSFQRRLLWEAAFFVVMPHKSSLSVIYTPFPYFEHIWALFVKVTKKRLKYRSFLFYYTTTTPIFYLHHSGALTDRTKRSNQVRFWVLINRALMWQSSDALVEVLKLKTVFEPMCQAAHHHKA